MRTIFFKTLILLFFLSLATFKSNAAVGDTTWVQAQNDKWLDYYNNFDTTVNFPNGITKYRKVLMLLNIGKYVCPGSPTYCSDWDYTVQIFSMNKLGDTAELGRYITPYGKGTRMPASWNQTFYYDVSDFVTYLKDSNTIRIHYSGYSGGFTANIKFAFIEGTPERDVIGVEKLWAGSWAYGKTSDPIDNHVASTTLTAPAGTATAEYRINITGHGSDPNYCSEFCSKYYQVLKGSTVVATKDIWRNNCGLNNLYPQTGTWVYDRANWCPGATVQTYWHPIPSIAVGTPFDVSMKFEPYASSGDASYTIFGNIVYYGSINKALDASLDDIIAPSKNDNYFRENSRIGYTTVKVRNTGSTIINNIEFEYGVTTKALTTYTWSGNINPLTDTIIDLPFASSLLKADDPSLLDYEVSILKVNGSNDDDVSNDKMKIQFKTVSAMPNGAVVTFLTNKSSNPSGFSETSWKIIDITTGAKIKSRENNAITTTYRDTLNLPTGIYKFVVEDEGCDGINWWANPSAGAGNIQIKPTLFTSYPLTGYFGGDFGCGFTQYFKVGDPSSLKTFSSNSNIECEIFPIPTHDLLNIRIQSTNTLDEHVEVKIMDMYGKTVYRNTMQQNEMQVNTQALSQGIYNVILTTAKNQFRFIKKITIIH